MSLVRTVWSIIATSFIIIGGCQTFEPAEPEKYSGFDCEQLDQLADAYRPTPQALLEQPSVNERERSDGGRTLSTAIFQDDRALSHDRDRDLRSIALARRGKGCQ